MIQTVRILAHTLTIIAALSKESMKDPPEPMHLGRDEHSRNEQTVLAAKIARILVPKRACSSTTTFCAFLGAIITSTTSELFFLFRRRILSHARQDRMGIERLSST
jgi:hypothetical protein